MIHFNQVNRDRWVVVQAKQIPPGSVVLDLGAGGGPYRSLFSHCDYKTQDFCGLDDEQISQGRYCQVDYVCDATAIPVATNTFDVVLSTEMLEHVPEPIRVIQEIARVLKPGGVLLLTAPLGSGLHQEPYHFYGGYTPYWYQKFLEEDGFVDISIESNAGSFAHFSQWCVWFAMASAPWRLSRSLLKRVCQLPLWVLTLPVMGALILYGCILDRFTNDRKFTVGYHVRAVKRE